MRLIKGYGKKVIQPSQKDIEDAVLEFDKHAKTFLRLEDKFNNYIEVTKNDTRIYLNVYEFCTSYYCLKVNNITDVSERFVSYYSGNKTYKNGMAVENIAEVKPKMYSMVLTVVLLLSFIIFLIKGYQFKYLYNDNPIVSLFTYIFAIFVFGTCLIRVGSHIHDLYWSATAEIKRFMRNLGIFSLILSLSICAIGVTFYGNIPARTSTGIQISVGVFFLLFLFGSFMLGMAIEAKKYKKSSSFTIDENFAHNKTICEKQKAG